MSTPIPDGHVLVTHFEPGYRRTKNGAWISDGGKVTDRVMPIEEAAKLHTGSGCYYFEYADGVTENLDCLNTPCRFDSTDPNAPRKTSRALGKIGYYGWSRE